MRINLIREMAGSHGISSAKRSKSELIKSIQSEEGNFDCFGSATRGECDQAGCLWREDCFIAAKK